MSYALNAGIEIQGSDGVWYQITDDNRQPIKIAYEIIEKNNRMAEGTLRRYVVARKHKINSSWQNVWSKTSMSSDGGKAAAWLKSFYEANVFTPVNVRLTVASVNTQNMNTTSGYVPTEIVNTPYAYSAGDTYIPSYVANSSGNMTYNVFITAFDYEIVNRNKDFDLVNVNIEFTEI